MAGFALTPLRVAGTAGTRDWVAVPGDVACSREKIAGIRTVEEEVHDEVSTKISNNLREGGLRHVD